MIRIAMLIMLLVRSVRDNWTDLSCVIATSEVVIGVSVEFEALNLII